MTTLTPLKHAGLYLRALGKRIRTPATRPYPWEASYPKGVSWHLDVEPRPLYSILDDGVAAYPKQTCLKFLRKKYSYREVGRLVDKAASGLLRLGVKRGTKVGLFLPNSPYFVICYYAILKAGGTVVNFDPLYAEREIAHQIRDSETSMMITGDLKTLYAKVAHWLDDTCLEKIVICRTSRALRFPQNFLFRWFKRKEIVPIPADGRHVTFDELIDNACDFTPTDVDPERDIAVLQYTGGSTGIPKGAMLTHANLYSNTLQVRIWANEVRFGNEKIVAVLPFCHAFGMAVMNFGLAIGAELILLPWFKVGEVPQAISQERATLLFGVPTIYSALSAHRDCQKYDLSTLRFCISAGAPLLPEIKSAFEWLTGCTVIEAYGLTEASPVCTVGLLDGRNKPGSAGLPVPGTIIEILSLANRPRVLPCGELGEVCVRGPQVMAGYWKQPEATQAVLSGGRLHTGDFGFVDEDGFVFIVDRIKEMIISGGYNVYPRRVEEALRLHPAVAQTAVCAVPDYHRGEILKAYVNLRDGSTLSAAELRAFLKDKLAPFEMPSEIEFSQEIPVELLHRPSRKDILAHKFSKGRRGLVLEVVGRVRDLLRRGGGTQPLPRLEPFFPKFHDRRGAGFQSHQEPRRLGEKPAHIESSG
jgi:long-chain acyl-CoA synthetase